MRAMDRRPIGIFDSGLGGLTALSRLCALLPNEKIVYLGDTLGVDVGVHAFKLQWGHIVVVG